MPLPLNLDYIKTKPGLFKTISVVVGAIALIFSATAYGSGKYYNFKCTPDQDTNFKRNFMLLRRELKELSTNLKIPFSVVEDNLPVPNSCEESRVGTHQHCEYQKRVRESLKPLLRIPTLSSIQAYKRIGQIIDEFPRECPPPWLPTASVYMIGITWGITFIVLIVLLVINVHENDFEQRLDIIGQCCVAGLFLLSTLFLLSFLILVATGKFPCTQKLFDKVEAEGREGRSLGTGDLGDDGLDVPDAALLKAIAVAFGTGASQSFLISDQFDPEEPGFGKALQEKLENVRRSQRRASSGSEETPPDFEDCADYTNYTYKTALLAVGTCFAAIATVLYGVSAVMLYNTGAHRDTSHIHREGPGTPSIVNSGEFSTGPYIKLSLGSDFSSEPPSELPSQYKTDFAENIAELYG